ncbi:sugar ABC transporter substrate-binding protein [Gulosibacter sp. 10]|uniref:ABC transporter substrate-binding protein n=1 Tax=Gulosibacter sp. 10 TaxID=1255570 RepID=UPI00097EEF36|nr:sugar ABC transporter substrate-binding protein [Gulosibacter sp. 10]SJM63496.1 UspC [Gulosibacter sp. 10]
MTFRRIAAGGTALLAAFALAGCAQGEGEGGGVTLSLRLWDENVASAYEQSIAEFEAANEGIDVELNVVPWDQYFTTLRSDVSAGAGDDVFWLNGANVNDYVSSGNLLDIDETLGADAKEAWNPAVVEQYTVDGALYGVPQITDGGSALYINEELLAEAGVTAQELSDATWSLDPEEDTLLPLLQQLTIDANGNNAASPEFDPGSVETYAFNASTELQNILLNFIGSNGGTFQDAEGNLTLTEPKTVEAFQYLVDLVDEYHVAPPAEATNSNGDYTRDQFLQGSLAVFESGTYSLAPIGEGASFDWAVTEIPAGPAGKVTTAPGVVAAGNANTEHPEEVAALLEWLGSAEGAAFIGAEGAAAPGVTDALESYNGYWEEQGVDTSPFFTVTEGETIPPVTGENYQAQQEAFVPHLNEVFLGNVPVEEGLQQAQDAADAVS